MHIKKNGKTLIFYHSLNYKVNAQILLKFHPFKNNIFKKIMLVVVNANTEFPVLEKFICLALHLHMIMHIYCKLSIFCDTCIFEFYIYLQKGIAFKVLMV